VKDFMAALQAFLAGVWHILHGPLVILWDAIVAIAANKPEPAGRTAGCTVVLLLIVAMFFPKILKKITK
jgi:hypothetical protein